MHCSSNACAQGKRPCPTPTACGATLGGGGFWPREVASAESADAPLITPEEAESWEQWAVRIVVAILVLVCLAAVIFN